MRYADAGFIWGLDFSAAGGPDAASAARQRAFAGGLIAETCGRDDVVLKLLPPITTERAVLEEGCTILARAIAR